MNLDDTVIIDDFPDEIAASPSSEATSENLPDLVEIQPLALTPSDTTRIPIPGHDRLWLEPFGPRRFGTTRISPYLTSEHNRVREETGSVIQRLLSDQSITPNRTAARPSQLALRARNLTREAIQAELATTIARLTADDSDFTLVNGTSVAESSEDETEAEEEEQGLNPVITPGVPQTMQQMRQVFFQREVTQTFLRINDIVTAFDVGLHTNFPEHANIDPRECLSPICGRHTGGRQNLERLRLRLITAGLDDLTT